MNTGRYNVRSLFTSTEIEQIIIPEIQRDYVWRESNVRGLMKSIMDHFSAKSDFQLDIVERQSGVPINEDVVSLLSEEYTRLVHSTRIGFIYAYHSVDFPGKFFLIDGQQRLTTIFLLLLASYKGAGAGDAYRKQYFSAGLPKIDYMVREVTHDFMVDFIEHEISGTKVAESFNRSKRFYGYYETDATTSCILRNYKVIEGILDEYRTNEEEQRFYKRLIDYVENYIEFNYFDTNISEQGEKLYLYMNSRGEDLSTQESLRPLLISRSKNKHAAGIKWEQWQNFFWVNRDANSNADDGFNEFLRWCTILHICTSSSPKLDRPGNSAEVKGDYIRIEKKDDKKTEIQKRRIRQYQEENNSFDIDFIEEIFEAVKRLQSLLQQENKYSYILNGWLNKIEDTNKYPCLLSCLEYMRSNKNADLDALRRVGMFIKNSMYYETNHKNPEIATVNAISAVKALADNGFSDMADLRLISGKVSRSIYTNTDKFKRACFNTMLRRDWESVIWDITEDNDFSSFLEGETLCLFEWSGYDVAKFRDYYEKLKCKVISVVKQPDGDQITLHEKLLAYGDFGFQAGTGNGMPRYYLLKYDSEWREGINNFASIRDILKKFLDGETPSYSGALYKVFVDEQCSPKSVLGYMEYLEYLKDDATPPHFILPKKYQISGDIYRELMVQWVHQNYAESWVYRHDTVVLPFEIIDGKVQFLDPDNDTKCFLDLYYDWNSGIPNWSFKFSSRNGLALSDHFSNLRDTWTREINSETGAEEYHKRNALSDDCKKEIHDRVKDVVDFVAQAFKELIP